MWGLFRRNLFSDRLKKLISILPVAGGITLTVCGGLATLILSLWKLSNNGFRRAQGLQVTKFIYSYQVKANRWDSFLSTGLILKADAQRLGGFL